MGSTVAFIGLGVMGGPMAGHLQQHGYNVRVFNRTRSKANDWADKYGGKAVESPREAAQGAEIVFTCVGNDDDLRSVVLGEQGALAGLKEGGLLVDHTTTSANVARELAQLAEQQQKRFLDAPVSGGQAGAESGSLSVMVGGTASDFDMIRPVVQSYAKAITLVGPVGSGQLCKMVNQICIGGLLQGLAEALNFAQRAELDVEKVLSVISRGAAQSWQMENRSATMLAGKYQHGFAVDWMRKDLGIVLNEARRNGANLPVTALVDEFYRDVQAMGGGRWDTSSLLARLQALTDDESKAAN